MLKARKMINIVNMYINKYIFKLLKEFDQLSIIF